MNGETLTGHGSLARLARGCMFAGAVSLGAIVGSGASGSAYAAVFDSVGDTATVSFNGIVNNNVVPGLTSEATFTLNTIAPVGANTVYTFGLSLENTSSAPITASRVSVIGFNTNPNAVLSASSVSGIFDTVSSGNVPMLGSFEFCASDGNCAGGAGGGVTFGNTGAAVLNIAFAGANVTSVVLDDFFVRYQAITSPTITDGSGVGVVPLPAALPLLVTALGGLGLVGWRRKSGVAAA
jgi:hypothetical protein